MPYCESTQKRQRHKCIWDHTDFNLPPARFSEVECSLTETVGTHALSILTYMVVAVPTLCIQVGSISFVRSPPLTFVHCGIFDLLLINKTVKAIN